MQFLSVLSFLPPPELASAPPFPPAALAESLAEPHAEATGNKR